MTTSHIKKVTAAIAVGAALAATGALPVFAQSMTAGITATASTSVTTGKMTTAAATKATKAAAALSTLITKADQDISARLTALNDLSTKVAGMKNVSAAEKAAISSAVQINIGGLNALQTKIDADTDITVARADAKKIFDTFRIYALVVPQGYIEVSADRVTTIGGLMTSLATKLQARLTTAEQAGKSTATLETALTDIATQVTAANSSAATALAGVANLTPDNGDAKIAASNKAALVAARASIKSANDHLKTARKDIQTITNGLKALNGTKATTNASASTTVSL